MKAALALILSLAGFAHAAEDPDCLPGSSLGLRRQTEELRYLANRVIQPKIDAYEDQLRKLSYGDQERCEHAGGVFDAQNEAGEKEKLRMSYLKGDALKLMITDPSIKQALVVEGMDKNRERDSYRGLLLQTAKGWFWVKPDKSIRMDLPYKSEQDFTAPGRPQQSMILREMANAKNALTEHLKSKTTPGFKIESLSFDNKMLAGSGSTGTKLAYDGNHTILDYTSHQSTGINDSWMQNPRIRVPPKMYELFTDPEFQAARTSRRFAEVMDRIYKKAQEVVGPNRTREALFVSLLFVDMRERGACGAVFGLRGRLGVPNSIFDGEEPSDVVGNRLDAAQHFFGYALMRNLSLGSTSRIVSEVGKERQYWMPQFNKYLQSFHGSGIDAPEAGYNESYGGMGNFGISEPPWAYVGKERTRSDVEIDKFYNNLGIEFGAQVGSRPSSLPSQVLNSRANDTKKLALGLEPSTERSWQAFDPYKEAPVARVLAPDQRRIVPVTQYQYDTLERLRWSGTAPVETLTLLRTVCENGGLARNALTTMGPKANGANSDRYCGIYNKTMRENSAMLYEKGMARRRARPSAAPPPSLPVNAP